MIEKGRTFYNLKKKTYINTHNDFLIVSSSEILSDAFLLEGVILY